MVRKRIMKTQSVNYDSFGFTLGNRLFKLCALV